MIKKMVLVLDYFSYVQNGLVLDCITFNIILFIDKRFFFVSNGYFDGRVDTIGNKIKEESTRHNCSTVTTMVLLRGKE